MNLSYWENKSWLSKVDFTIIGSGITGLNTALCLKQKQPKANVLILERGFIPNGASTKNAGFACFGSLSEIVDDLNSHTEEEVVQLIERRIQGLQLLRNNLGDRSIGYKSYGGYELFALEPSDSFEYCMAKMPEINKLLYPVFNKEVFEPVKDPFNFRRVQEKLVFNQFEAQIDTGKMMLALLQKVQGAGVKILNTVNVEEYAEKEDSVEVKTNHFTFNTKNLLIATNGFGSKLGISAVKPARAQVLITKPVKDLSIKGTFHLDKGFYYFRNINNRILLGGGRNLNFEAEETTEIGETALIQNRLEELLRTSILPGTPVEIENRWSGIMGMGEQKRPVVEEISSNVFCGVRLGGMGIAIGSLVGKELAQLALKRK